MSCPCKTYQRYGSCNCLVPIAAPPAPCCESHSIEYRTGFCLHVNCDVVATTGTFILNFSNCSVEEISVNANDVFFYHAVAGVIKILAIVGGGFQVVLENQAKAGSVIRATDCVHLAILPNHTSAGNISRCLSGNFQTPALNVSRIIYILNGSSIPVGSTITFTYQGQTGSYTVDSFVSGTGSIYAYSVTNTGSGLTPGTIVEAGEPGACLVPIEIITNVNGCNLSATQIADSMRVCYNGTERAFTPTAPNQGIVSNSALDWEPRNLTNLDCCVTTGGTLKFTQTDPVTATDTVVLENIGLDCFVAAVSAAFGANNLRPVKINGLPFVVTAYDSGTKLLTLTPASPEIFIGPTREFPKGTQICLGTCCNNCDGPETTNANYVGPGGDATTYSTFSFTTPGVGALTYGGLVPTYYLVGKTPSGVLDIQTLTAAYNDIGGVLPRHADNMIIRQKICNTSPLGCDQDVEFDFNFELEFSGVPAGLRVEWELGHFCAESRTLEDGVTLNPFSYASTKAGATGSFVGPTVQDTAVTTLTNLGYGGIDQPKYYPAPKGFFRDFSHLRKGDCINSIVWLFIRLQPLSDLGANATIGMAISLRRRLKKSPINQTPYPQNLDGLETWKL